METHEQLFGQTFRSSPEREQESERERRGSDGERVNEREQTCESADIRQHGTVRENIASAARGKCGCGTPCSTSRPHTTTHTNIDILESADIHQHGIARSERGCGRSPHTKRAKATMATVADQIEMVDTWGDLRNMQLSNGGETPCSTSRPHTTAHTNIDTQIRTLSTTHPQQREDGQTKVTEGSGTAAWGGPRGQQPLNSSPAHPAGGGGCPAAAPKAGRGLDPPTAPVAPAPANETQPRRSSRRRTRNAAAQDALKECDERALLGHLCPTACNCLNSLPAERWQEDVAGRRSKVRVASKCGVDEASQGLVAIDVIEDREVITVFGNSAVVSQATGGMELQRLIQQQSEQQQDRRFQYTFSSTTANEDGNVQKQVWVVPPQDVYLAERFPISNTLKHALSQRGPPGVGQFANHTCCPLHTNAEIRMAQAPDGSFLAVLRARKRINVGTAILIQYADLGKDRDQWHSTFACTCCRCRGVCPQQGNQTGLGFLAVVNSTSLSEQQQRELEDQHLEPGTRVQLGGSLRHSLGNVIKVTGSKVHVRTFREDEKKMEDARVERADCAVVPDTLQFPGVKLERTNLQRVRFQPTPEGSSDYLEEGVVEAVLRWSGYGSTMRAGLQAVDGRFWMASPWEYSNLLEAWTNCQDTPYPLSSLANGIGSIGLRRIRQMQRMALDPAVYDDILLPVRLRAAKHWLLVAINNKSRTMSLLDCSQEFGKKWRGEVHALTWAWFLGVHRHLRAKGESRVQEPQWTVDISTVNFDDLSGLPGFTPLAISELRQLQKHRLTLERTRQVLGDEAWSQLSNLRIQLCAHVAPRSENAWQWSTPAPSIPQQTRASDCAVFTLFYGIFLPRGWSLSDLSCLDIEKARGWILKVLLEGGEWVRCATCVKCGVELTKSVGSMVSNRHVCEASDKQDCSARVRRRAHQQRPDEVVIRQGSDTDGPPLTKRTNLQNSTSGSEPAGGKKAKTGSLFDYFSPKLNGTPKSGTSDPMSRDRSEMGEGDKTHGADPGMESDVAGTALSGAGAAPYDVYDGDRAASVALCIGASTDGVLSDDGVGVTEIPDACGSASNTYSQQQQISIQPERQSDGARLNGVGHSGTPDAVPRVGHAATPVVGDDKSDVHNNRTSESALKGAEARMDTGQNRLNTGHIVTVGGMRQMAFSVRVQGTKAEMDTACAHCGRLGVTSRCMRCKGAHYCDRYCLVKHRKRHRATCTAGSWCAFCGKNRPEHQGEIRSTFDPYGLFCSVRCRQTFESKRQPTECTSRPDGCCLEPTGTEQSNGQLPQLNAKPQSNQDPAGGKCSHCGKDGAVIQCKRCHTANYCGPSCRSAHWPTHRSDCCPGEWCATCNAPSTVVRCEDCEEVGYCSPACRFVDASKHSWRCNKKRTTMTNDWPALPKKCDPTARLRGHVLCHDQKAQHELTAMRKLHRLEKPDGNEEQPDPITSQEEEQCRSDLVEYLHSCRVSPNDVNLGNDLPRDQSAPSVTARSLLLQASLRSNGLMALTTEAEAIQEMSRVDAWVSKSLRPWVRAYRQQRYEVIWQRFHADQFVTCTFCGLAAYHAEEAIAQLQAAGVQTTPDRWEGAVYSARHTRSSRRLAVTFSVPVTKNLALWEICIGVRRVAGQEIMCDITPVGAVLDNLKETTDTAVLRPPKRHDPEQLKTWTEMWYRCGVTEAELREIILYSASRQVPEHSAHSITVWSPHVPKPLHMAWDGTGFAQGQIRITGEKIEGGSSYVMNNACAIAGQHALENRHPEGTHYLPNAMQRPALRKPMSIGLPEIRPQHAVEQGHPQLEQALLSDAPEWLRRHQLQVIWEPLAAGSDLEAQSSVCIRFAQTALPPYRVDATSRHTIRELLVELLNAAQHKCMTDAPPFEFADVNYMAFTNNVGMLEGMITLEKRSAALLDSDIITGTVLAFCLGNTVPHDTAGAVRWCPVARQFGITVCGITGLTVATAWSGPGRRQAVMGTQVRDCRVWDISDPKEQTIRRIIAMLNGRGNKADLLSRIRTLPWDKKRQIMLKSQCGPRGGPLRLMETASGGTTRDNHESLKARWDCKYCGCISRELCRNLADCTTACEAPYARWEACCLCARIHHQWPGWVAKACSNCRSKAAGSGAAPSTVPPDTAQAERPTAPPLCSPSVRVWRKCPTAMNIGPGPLRQEKRKWLQERGEQVAAHAVTGDWSATTMIDKQQQSQSWANRRWAAAAWVSRFWQATREQWIPAYLQQLREAGHIDVANVGISIFFDDSGRVARTWHEHKGIEVEQWLIWLEMACMLTRQQEDTTVVTWNVGPLGYDASRAQIFSTLQQQFPIVMLQEVNFAPGHKRRIKREIRDSHEEYICIMSDTWPGAELDKDAGSCPPQLHDKRKRHAVVTCLHRNVFKSVQQREWMEGADSKEFKHMARGRVLWIDAVTWTGKAVRVINIHQATSSDPNLQQKVLLTLQSKLAASPNLPTILGGDLNAHANGLRQGYVSSNHARLERCTEHLRAFVSATRGRLISPRTSSWQDVNSARASKLDHLVVWHYEGGSTSGQADWVGTPLHDHARIRYAIDWELLQPTRTWEQVRQGPKRLQLKDWERLPTVISRRLSDEAMRLVDAVERGDLDAGQAKDQMLRSRQNAATEHFAVAKSKRRDFLGRMAHRDHQQILCMRDIARHKAALRVVPGLHGVSAAQEHCLRDLDLSEQLHLTQHEKGTLVRSSQWRKLLQARIATRESELQQSIAKQESHNKWISDKKARQQFENEQGGQKRFTGKLTGGRVPEVWRWTVVNGIQWLLDDTTDDQALWDDRIRRLQRQAPQVTVQMHRHEVSLVKVVIKQDRRTQATATIQQALATWKQRVADWHPAELTQALRSEIQQEAATVDSPPDPTQLLMRAIENVWQRKMAGFWPGTGVVVQRDGITECRWIAEGAQARQALERWVQHLLDCASDTAPLYTSVSYEQNSRSIRMTHAQAQWCRDIHWTPEATCEELHTESSPRADDTASSPMRDASPFETWSLLPSEAGKETSAPQQSLWVITATTPRLDQIGTLLRHSQTWDPSHAMDHAVLINDGPWRNGEHGANMTLAMELYFQEQGLSTYAKCQYGTCPPCKPHVVVQEKCSADSSERRQLVGFCPSCWRHTDIRHGREQVADMSFMHAENIFEKGKNIAPSARLRGRLTLAEFRKYIKQCLRNGKSPGPDASTNEALKSLTEEELRVLWHWVNEILQENAPRVMTVEEMNGTIRLLHKGGESDDKPKDWRPVVLLNCTNQLVMHVLNARLRTIVEKAGILEPGQTGGRRCRGTDINMAKLDWVTRQAVKQGHVVYRIDVDFSNAFNAMNQAALWAIMRAYNIPDVDLLMSLYEHSTVRVSPNDEQCATITFDTGVAQGSVLSPLLFLIFMNALLGLLTARGKKLQVSHGLPEHGVGQFNNMGFVDDLTLFAQSLGGAQALIDVVHEFEQWSGLRVNRDKSKLLVIRSPRAAQTQTEQIEYQGLPIETLSAVAPCRYLGYWGTAGGDMTATKQKVIDKTKDACALLEHHPLTTARAIDLFISTGVGAFRYSAALVPWTEQEMNDLEKLWVQAYKNAWHLPQSTASDIFILPVEQGGLGLPRPLGIMTQEMCRHIQRCLRHEDAAKHLTLMEFEQSKSDWACTSLRDLREEMELWSWDQVVEGKWTKLAKCLQMLNIPATWLLDEAMDNPELTGLAQATRDIRRLRRRVEAVGGRRDSWAADAWHIEQEQWKLLWDGEEAFWKSVPHLHRADIVRVEQLPQEPKPFRQGGILPTLFQEEQQTGAQRIRVLTPRGLAGISDKVQGTLQRWIDLIDWRALHLRQDTVRQANSIRPYLTGMVPRSHPAVTWVSHREPVGGQSRGNERISTAEECAHIITTWWSGPLGGQQAHADDVLCDLNVGRQPGTALRGLLRALREQQPTAGQIEDVAMHIGNRLPPGWRARWATQIPFLLHATTVDECINIVKDLLCQIDDRCGLCQTRKTVECASCHLRRCRQCQATQCSVCDATVTLVRTSDDDTGTTTQEADSGRHPANADHQRYRRPKQMVVNVHALGELFIESVHDVRWTLDPVDSPGEHLQFRAQVRGWNNTDRAARRQRLLALSTDTSLRSTLVHATAPDLFFLPREMWPNIAPEQEETGWWYKVVNEILFRKCKRCHEKKTQDCYDKQAWSQCHPAECRSCQPKNRVQAKKRRREMKMSTIDTDSVAVSRTRRPRFKGTYRLHGSSESDEALSREYQTQIGLLLSTADPRYVGRGDDVSGGDVILDCDEIRSLLKTEASAASGATSLWLTTRDMGWSLTAENNEVEESRDIADNKPTKRQLAPAISAYIRAMYKQRARCPAPNGQDPLTAAWELDQIWGEWSEHSPPLDHASEWVPCFPTFGGDIRRQISVSVQRSQRDWEQPSTPLLADDPPPLPATELGVQVGRDVFLDEELPRAATGQGYVSVTETSLLWKDSHHEQIFTYQGLTTNMDLDNSWTVMSGIWHHLQAQNKATNTGELARFLSSEIKYQNSLETQGYRSPTWRLLRALQNVHGATTVQGESAVSAPPFFQTAGRGDAKFWGDVDGPTVFLWEGLDDLGKQHCIQIMNSRTDWVVWSRSNAPRHAKDQRPFGTVGVPLFQGIAKPGSSAQTAQTPGKALREKGWWRRGAIETSANSVNMTCWVHKAQAKSLSAHETTLKDAWENTDTKDECEVCLTGPEKEFWLGTEIGMLGGYGFQGATFGIDGSNSDGTMGAGCCCLEVPALDCQARVGRELEGTSSARPEFGGLLLSLQTVPDTVDALILSDNESVLKTIQQWVGEGGKATLANAPDADILREILAVLSSRIMAGSATFLVKVKSHRGEPLNEKADLLAEQGRRESDEKKRWNERTDRIVFSLDKQDDVCAHTSAWTNKVRDTIRKRASEEKLARIREKAARAWLQPPLDGDEDDLKQYAERCKTLTTDTAFKTAEMWNKQCARTMDVRGVRTPVTGTWSTNFLIREGQTREQLGKWLTKKSIPEKRRRRMLQLVTNSFPCGANVHRRQKNPCVLCKRELESTGRPVPSQLPDETVNHIQSAGCIAQRDVVTKAHNESIKALMDDVVKHGQRDRTLEFVTLDSEHNLRTLWANTRCAEVCEAEELWQAAEPHEKAAREQAGISFDDTLHDNMAERFWRKRPDGVALDHEKKVCYLIEFKRTGDRWPDYRQRAEQRAERQYSSLVQGLSQAGQSRGWAVQQIILVGGICGSVDAEKFNSNMAALQVAPNHWADIRNRHAQKLLEVSERVLRSYYSCKYGNNKNGCAQATNLGPEHIGQDVYV